MRLVEIDVIHISKYVHEKLERKMNRVLQRLHVIYMYYIIWSVCLSACLFACLALALALYLFLSVHPISFYIHVCLSTRFTQMLAHEVLA